MSFLSLLGLATVVFTSSGNAADDPAQTREKWQRKAVELRTAPTQSEFCSAIRAIPQPAHARGEVNEVGGSIYRSSWSGVVMQVDADWWIVREAAARTNANPPPQGVPIEVHVVGISDLRESIDPALYEAVRVIHRSPPATDSGFDPVNLVRAVNYLQAMGEKKAIAAMEEYSRVCLSNRDKVWHRLDDTRIILLARLLWVSGPGKQGASYPILGSPDICIDGHVCPLFPLTVQDELPLQVNHGYLLAGLPEDPIGYMDRCRGGGVFRQAPMTPSQDPVITADMQVEALAKAFCPGSLVSKQSLADLLRTQALAAIGARDTTAVSDAQWQDILEAHKRDGMVWNAELQDFVVRSK